MWIWVALFYAFAAHAGLECHENDIKKTQRSLEAVAASECRESGKIKAAVHQVRELGYESLCDPAIMDKIKPILLELRIDSWIKQDRKVCEAKIKEALRLLGQLKRSEK